MWLLAQSEVWPSAGKWDDAIMGILAILGIATVVIGVAFVLLRDGAYLLIKGKTWDRLQDEEREARRAAEAQSDG